MDPDTMTELLRGGHIDMPERIRRGLWPHPPIALEEVIGHLQRIAGTERWFPGTIEEVGLDKPDIEGQMTIENRGRHNYVCHFADHYRRVSKRFLSPRGAAKFYIRWELHLPGDLDGWKVV